MLDARGGDKFPRREEQPNPAYCVPLSALGGHGIGACAVGNAQAALESTIASVKERSTNLYRREDARLPGGAAARGSGGREDRRRAPHPAQRLLAAQEIAGRKQIADVPTKLRFKRNLAYAVSLATRRWTRCTRWPAPTASTRPIRWSAFSATRTRSLATSASASTRRPRDGGSSRSGRRL